MIERRKLLIASAIAAAGTTMLPGKARAALPDLSKLKTRPSGPIEVVWKTPHGKPNGMDIDAEGMWIMDQGPENYISVVNPDSGKLIREFKAEGVLSASGVGVDANNVVWVGSTYSRFIVSVDGKTGKLIQKYSTPGAGQIYKTKDAVAGHRTPLKPAYPPAPPPPPNPNAPPRPTGRQGAGPQDAAALDGPAGTGAHCVLPKGNLLYVAVPPARMIYAIDKATWVVQDMFMTAGDRPHDFCWSDATKTKIWASDSNLNAFFLHDLATGQMSERIQLPDDSPIIHGAKIHNGYMYYCDDVGWMCRFKM